MLDLEPEERPEKSETELMEKLRSKGGQASSAGEGSIVGDGEFERSGEGDLDLARFVLVISRAMMGCRVSWETRWRIVNANARRSERWQPGY